jgi:hypothetical protein
MARARLRSDESGQSTVEWIGLVLLVSLVVAAFGAVAGIGLPGAALAHAIGSKIICAVGLSDSCVGEESSLALAYGTKVAALVAEHAPTIAYEDGMKALPVDYRSCREDACADGAAEGNVWRSQAGERTVAFLRVIDCRPGSPTATQPDDADCNGERAGNLYLQYWLYYPGSATGEGSVAPGLIRGITGGRTYHPDDWESYTVRIGPGGVDQRASSHHGYGRGWVPEHGVYAVAGGSHAGEVLPLAFGSDRTTPGGRLSLIPLEPIAAENPDVEFAVTPPWLKKVWRDPEYEGTD